MRGLRFAHVCAVAGVLLIAPAPLWAQTQDAQALRQEIDQLRKELDALQKQYGDRLSALEAKLNAGEPAAQQPVVAGAPQGQAPAGQATAPVPPGAEAGGGAAGTLPVYGAGAASSKVFNPDIAVIGDFLGAAGHNSVNPSPAFAMHESEASFQAIVDPYARADFFLSFGEEGVDLEEGFVTFPTVPGGLLVRAGKVRAAFGKVNALHNHVLPWADRPLVTENLVGGEEGISDAGLSVARLVPNPWFFLEATGQVFRGDSGDLFHSSEPSDLSYVAHLRGYHDLTENTNIDLGTSYARGHNASGVFAGVDLGQFTTQLYGIDATLRWRPLQRSIYRSFVGRSELIWSRRQQPGGEQNAFGYYLSGEYQFARRWFGGARYDRSDHANEATLHDSGGSLFVTYWPSEFNQLRGQYRRTDYATGDPANEFLFQFQFSIGAHGAHPF
jgi:hypothetical protein